MVTIVTCGIKWVNQKNKKQAKQVLVLSVSCKHGLSNISD